MPTIRELRERRGLTLEALGQAVGSNRQQIWKLENGYTRLTLDWMIKLAGPLGVEPKDLVPESVDAARSLLPRARRMRPAEAMAPPRGDMIPIKSAARGGDEQEMFLAEPIGFTPRPPNLAGVREAYAIYMVGDSMLPRYEPGWILHVNPYKPARPGRDVVLYLKNGSVVVKQFVRASGEDLVLHQLNPGDDLFVDKGDVREMHLVVGVDQEG